MKHSKKILIIFFALLLLPAIISFARDTEVTYPVIPGFESITPTETKSLLPEYIKYVFTFAIIISAIVAFFSFLYGGFRWLTSAGSSSALGDAKDRMKTGALGLVAILFASVILNVINPQLLTISPTVAVRWGITLYPESGCAGTGQELTRNSSGLSGFSFMFNSEVPPNSLDIKINGSTIVGRNEDNSCRNTGSISSVEFIWKLPGVYLTKDGGIEKFLPASTATLGDFNDAVRGVKFNNIENVSYGAVMHEDQSWKGNCKVFASSGGVSGIGVSSVTTFTRAGSPGPGGVTFFENDNFGGGNFGAAVNPADNPTACTNVDIPSKNDWVTSMKISGNYIAILFEHTNCTGKCQVFTGSDSNFRDDEIGRCNCGPFGWGCGDCLTSYMVIPTR